jgi:hypothetical protein
MKEDWIKINPFPEHNEKCDILLKNGTEIKSCVWDSIEREFHKIIDKNYFFHELNSIDSWKKTQ